MSYYTQDQQQQQWHQHSQTANYNTTSPPTSQTNGNLQNGQQRTGPIGPILNQTVNNIVTDLKSNIDKDYFKTTCGLLNSVEVIASLIIFIIATNLHSHPFLTLLTGFAFWISLFFLLVNLFQLPEKIAVIPWTKSQLCFCGVTSILLVIEALVVFFSSIILGLLVIHLAALYGYHGYDKLKEWGRIMNEQRQQQANPQQSTNLNV